jgi:hypothetical protein
MFVVLGGAWCRNFVTTIALFAVKILDYAVALLGLFEFQRHRVVCAWTPLLTVVNSLIDLQDDSHVMYMSRFTP